MRKFIIIVLSLLMVLCYAKAGYTKNIQGEIIKLPNPRLKSSVSLEQAIAKRRSKRYFTSKSLSLSQISQLLWAAQGITDKYRKYRTAPSAGALYPLEVYIVISSGVYHYDPFSHQIKRKVAGDYRFKLAQACWGQSYPAKAPCSIVITGIYRRTSAKYGNRAKLYVHLEAGHSAQNILLQATALGLGAVPIGAFNDNAVQRVLRVPSDYTPLYVISAGFTN